MAKPTIEIDNLGSKTNDIMINVKYPPKGYNAVKGDGTTDDITAINSLSNYLYSRGGGKLYFPNGTYKLSTDALIKDNVEFIGQTVTSTIFNFTAGAVLVYLNSKIENITVQNTNISLIRSNSKAVNCIVSSSPNYGIVVDTTNKTLENIRIIDCVANNTLIYGFAITASSPVTKGTAKNIKFENCKALGNGGSGGMGYWGTGFACENVNIMENIIYINCIGDGAVESGFHIERAIKKKNIQYINCISRNNGHVKTVDDTFYGAGYFEYEGITFINCKSENNLRNWQADYLTEGIHINSVSDDYNQFNYPLVSTESNKIFNGDFKYGLALWGYSRSNEGGNSKYYPVPPVNSYFTIGTDSDGTKYVYNNQNAPDPANLYKSSLATRKLEVNIMKQYTLSLQAKKMSGTTGEMEIIVGFYDKYYNTISTVYLENLYIPTTTYERKSYNLGFGTSNPFPVNTAFINVCFVLSVNGDIVSAIKDVKFIENRFSAMYLKSPDNTLHKIEMDNGGAFISTNVGLSPSPFEYTNLVVDADFTDGQSHNNFPEWTLTNMSAIEYTGNEIKLTPTGANATFVQSNITYIAGHKYYAKALVNGDSSDLSFFCTDNVNFTYSANHSTTRGYENLSFVFTPTTVTTGNTVIGIKHATGVTANKIELRRFLLVDLTAIELQSKDKTWCDSNIAYK